jgi:hypothetical protein
MPEGQNGGIPLAQFEAAHIGPVDPHPLGKFSLRQASRNPQLPDVSADHAPHVLGHGRNFDWMCI